MHNEMLPCMQFNDETYAIQTKADKTNHLYEQRLIWAPMQCNEHRIAEWMNGDGVCYFVINR